METSAVDMQWICTKIWDDGDDGSYLRVLPVPTSRQTDRLTVRAARMKVPVHYPWSKAVGECETRSSSYKAAVQWKCEVVCEDKYL